MNDYNKTKRTSTPLIKKLMANAPVVERRKNKTRVEIACRIDDLIKEKQFKTYSEFALKIGKHQSEITKWVSGSHNFTIDTLNEIAFALNIELAELFLDHKPKVVYKTRVEVIAIHAFQNPYANNQYHEICSSNNYGLKFNGMNKTN
jgi:transcriptional regulator with XRE-family HTH domain